MNARTKQWLAWVIVAVVLTAVSVGLGVSYPLPPMPVDVIEEINEAADPENVASQAVGPVRFRSLLVLNDLTVKDDVTITGDVDVDGTLNADAVDFDDAMDLASTLDVDGATTLNSTLDVDGAITSGTGAITMTDNVIVDGAADAVQLMVSGYTTQTNDLVQLDGGLVDIGGGTYGTADGDNDVGIAGDLEVEGNVILADGGYPLEFATGARRAFVGSTSAFTGTTTVLSDTHGCTTAVVLALCQMQDPDDDAGDAFLCVGSVSGTTVTISAFDDAGDPATEVDTVADYIIIGY